MEFRILGPVEVREGAHQVALGGAKPRALLAALLLEAGHVVPAGRLMEVVWGDRPPDTARAVLQTYVSSLRRSLTRAGLPPVIGSHRVGYLAEIPPGTLDLHVAEHRIAEARSAAADGRHEEAVASFQAALALWRGPALGGTGDVLPQMAGRRLDELRLTVTGERIAAELETGRPDRLIGELTELVAHHPLHEGLRGHLMTALYRAGRQSDALAEFRRGAAALADELGIDPGPELRRLQEAILRADPALARRSRLAVPAPPAGPARPSGPADPPSPSRPPEPAGVPPRPAQAADGGTEPVPPSLEEEERERVLPRQLPPSPFDFTGRDTERASLRTALTRPDATPICVISGPGGVGKSALALRVAHDIADRYSDGQIHVELRGTSDTVTPDEVLARLLRELGIPAGELPTGLEERVNRYRTLLAGRRMLLVLDDAAGERQVRPLLPGSPGCAVLVTSRNRLAGLAGSLLTDLGVMDTEAGLELLGRIAGADRVAAEPEDARRIVGQCGALPLAIRVAGARLAARRQWSVGYFTRRLTDERHRLDELAVGDQEVRASISLSYDLLSEPARRALRYLGWLGLPHFPAWVAAAALDADDLETDRLLEQLVDASLVDVEGVDATGGIRYRLHDLIRLFAREQAEVDDSGDGLRAAVRRVLGSWLWLLDRTGAAVPPGTPTLRAGHRHAVAVDPEVEDAVLADPAGWIRMEEENLAVGVERAAAEDLDDIVIEVASATCASPMIFENNFVSWERIHDAALGVVQRTGNTLGEATLLACLGQVRLEQDRFTEARTNLGRALRIFRSIGDAHGERVVLALMGGACREQGDLPEALRFLGLAEEKWRGEDDVAALAHVLRLKGAVLVERGELESSAGPLAEALDLYRSAGSLRGEGLVLRTMALRHLAGDDPSAAEEDAGRALRIFTELNDRLLGAHARRTWAKARLRLGDPAAAREPLEAALAVARSMGDRWGEALALRTLGQRSLAAGEPAEAEAFLREAIERFAVLRLPLYRARCLRDLAVLHDSRGEGAAARAARAEAMEIFRDHGTREYGELAEIADDR
ncbi:BTAD domain-containing putative transcriptional regulator [Streptosporangium sp. NPDC004379]|uniref:AfsR/SARP family transcriptional regulator n=1 Tax=Streptosporangium sp. NPDC004379 TaxID=3366189 RepID=UPI00368720BC